MPRVTVSDGSELYYEVHGDGPRTIVFAHGAGGNHLSWWQQVPRYRDEYRCITFDHRGFGTSTDATGQFLRSYRADLEALLDDAGVREAVLVGQSMGGFTCVAFAAAYPDRVRGLVMADTFLGIDDEGLIAEWREGLAARPAPADPTRQTSMVAAGYVDNHPEGVFLYQQVRALNPPRDLSGVTFSVEDGAVPASELAKLTMPVLFLAGDEDAVIPAPLIERASALVPGARYVGVPGAGHSVYWENAAAFNELLDGLLAEAFAN
jgi:3-oxoadipate enol-lactonase